MLVFSSPKMFFKQDFERVGPTNEASFLGAIPGERKKDLFDIFLKK